MKTPPIALLNGLGFANANQKVAYAGWVLNALTTPSPKKVVITPRGQNQPEISTPIVKNQAEFIEFTSCYILQPEAKLKGFIHIPILNSYRAINAEFNVNFIGELIPSITIDDWLGNIASSTPETLTQNDEPATLEQYLFKYSELSNDVIITYPAAISYYDVKTGKSYQMPVVTLELDLPLSQDYDYNNPQLQLDKITVSTPD